MAHSSPPLLAAPGAGLPAIEQFIARRMFALRCWTGNRELFDAQFRKERGLIRSLLDSCDSAKRSERVLIQRLRGLEDSSRHWSVWMTLDHLRITNEAFAQIITELSHGRAMEGAASTAAVKPSSEVTSEVEEAYERSCQAVLAAVDAAPQMKTALRFFHPWFGQLDAFQWHALASMHMGIHRAQIQSILKGL